MNCLRPGILGPCCTTNNWEQIHVLWQPVSQNLVIPGRTGEKVNERHFGMRETGLWDILVTFWSPESCACKKSRQA